MAAFEIIPAVYFAFQDQHLNIFFIAMSSILARLKFRANKIYGKKEIAQIML
jgi:hypothetical protein